MRVYRRTAAVALMLVLALAAATLFGGSAHSQAPAFPGMARASGSILSVIPAVGGLQLPIRVGSAATEVQNTVASAQAHSVNLGLIETTLTAEDCAGNQTVPSELFPAPTRVDNRSGNASATEDEVAIPAGFTFGGGREHVEATTQPRSLANSIPSQIELGPLVITAGEALSTSQVIDGETYEARAIVESSLEIAGVKLSGLRWEALHRVGAEHVTEGSFAMTDPSTGGLDALEPVVDLLNNVVLAPFGISLTLPEVEIIEEPFEIVRVTPLAITMVDTPVGSTLLNPILEATSGLRADLFETAVEVLCQLGSFLFVGDVGLTIASGNGSLQIAVGGVQARAGELDQLDPLEGAGEAPPIPEPPAPATTTTETTQDEIPPSPPQPEQITLTVAPDPSEAGCSSLHPFQWPPCSRGAAGLAGLIGLAALAAIATLDWRHQRRVRAGAGSKT